MAILFQKTKGKGYNYHSCKKQKDFDHGNSYLLEEKERWEAFDLESVSDVFVLGAIYFCQNSGGCLSRQDFCCSIVFWLKFLAMTANKRQKVVRQKC